MGNLRVAMVYVSYSFLVSFYAADGLGKYGEEERVGSPVDEERGGEDREGLRESEHQVAAR